MLSTEPGAGHRVRALFLFAEGEPIGKRGLYWLKEHAANCYDFEKVSKKPFGRRIAWVETNLQQIKDTAASPLDTVAWWKEADKPFQFLAACFELTAAITDGPNYVGRLPVAFDGSCSGLQHMCAMTRSEEGEQVNLTKQTEPQDIYQIVADAVKQKVEDDLADEENGKIARRCLAWIWNPQAPARPRKTFKRNVMTYSYSSTLYGMADQLQTDTMKPLARDVFLGKLKEHPFGHDDGRWAAQYLATHAFKVVQQLVTRPAGAMGFLRKLVRALASEEKHLHWLSPAGIPVINSYTEKETKRVHLWRNKRGVLVKTRTKLAMKDAPEIDTDAAANAVVANFVHSCDAAHLMLTVNAAVSEGITSIATVHDCFGCVPSRAERFREIIREEFVGMYEEHDVLREVFEQARADLCEPKTKRMPEGPPEWGTLDIKQVLGAEYAFA
jgi:DNA-directed RNA polymerase, mitochondrial